MAAGALNTSAWCCRHSVAVAPGGEEHAEVRGIDESVVVEVDGKRIEVTLPTGFRSPAPAHGTKKAAPRRKNAASGAAATGDAVAAPMQGTIVKVEVAEGDAVNEGDLIVVLEAMKMEQPLTAHKSGTVTSLSADVGATVTPGSVICDLKD